MRDARLACCLEHQDLTLEDWNNVILLHRRGEYRISLSKIQSLLEFESLVIYSVYVVEKFSPLFSTVYAFYHLHIHLK